LIEIVKVAAEECATERLLIIRIPKKFKLVYSTSKALVENPLVILANTGVLIPTKALLVERTQYDLKIVMPVSMVK
jgi:hypothetical protein